MTISQAQQAKDYALIKAVTKDDVKAVRSAIENGANPNTRWQPHGQPNRQNYTALHLAVHRESVGVVKELLKAENINVNARDGYGSTALSSATFMHMASIVEALLKHPKIKPHLKDDDEKRESPWDHARMDTTENGPKIRGLFAKKEKMSWEEAVKNSNAGQAETKTLGR